MLERNLTTCSVCLSVRLAHAGVDSKLMTVGSCSFCYR